MTRFTAIRSSKPVRDWILTWVCGTIIGLLASDVVLGSYDAGLSPLKPSLFLWGSAAFCIGMALISDPKLCPAVPFILILPVWRVLDAALLARFEAADVTELMMNPFRALVGLLAVLAVLSTSASRPAVLWAAIVAIVMTTGSEIAEAVGLAKFTPIPGRFCGFSQHPNWPPMILSEMLGVIFALSKNFRLNMIMLAIAFPGVALTYGRSGMVCLGLMAFVYVMLNARRHPAFILTIVLVCAPLVGIGFAYLKSNTEKGVVKDKDTGSRIEAIYSLDFDKLQSPERAKDLMDAVEGAMKKPIFGQGVGSSGSAWAPHNEVVSIWLEIGIPGLLIFSFLHLGLTWASIARGGIAGFCIYAIWFFVPAAQGRIDSVHYWLAASVAAHLIWTKRYGFVLRPARNVARPVAPFASPPLS
jgi:O-Antigen ligase